MTKLNEHTKRALVILYISNPVAVYIKKSHVRHLTRSVHGQFDRFCRCQWHRYWRHSCREEAQEGTGDSMYETEEEPTTKTESEDEGHLNTSQ